MIIGVPKEICPGETRVALTPANVGTLIKKKQDLKILVESGAGEAAGYTDAAYQEAGGHEPWVWRERRFAVRLPEPGGEEDAILHGEFDRVVVERDSDGKPLRAHVVDFKTGQVRDEEELERKREAYRPQMLAYRRAVCALTGLPQEAVRLSLLFVDAGRVAHLDEA